MEHIEKSWLKYPQSVYFATKVDTVELRKCSDLKVDYELCSEGLFFMENRNQDPTFKFNPNLDESKLESKTISDGTVFYRDKHAQNCPLFKTMLIKCQNSFRDTRGFLKKSYENYKEKFESNGIMRQE